MVQDKAAVGGRSVPPRLPVETDEWLVIDDRPGADFFDYLSPKNLATYGGFADQELDMNDFRVIYRILRELSAAIDADEFDPQRLTPEAVGTSEKRFNALMVMLVENGYVEGVTARRYVSSPDPWPRAQMVAPRITLKGLEYLHENSIMKRCAEVALGVASAIC